MERGRTLRVDELNIEKVVAEVVCGATTTGGKAGGSFSGESGLKFALDEPPPDSSSSSTITLNSLPDIIA